MLLVKAEQEAAVTLAKRLASCTPSQQRQIVQAARKHPETGLAELAKQTSSMAPTKTVLAELTLAAHARLIAYAATENLSQSKALARLLDIALDTLPRPA